MKIDEETKVGGGETFLDTINGKTTACLIVIHGANLGKKYDLVGTEAIIGRGENSEIRINEDNVSRKHAEIKIKGEKISIQDLGSTNGTFVNTKRSKTTVLRDGDLVLVGNTILKFISRKNIENAYHDEIYRLATLDGLTQCYNKKFFLERLSNEYSRSDRYKRNLSLIMLDFDHFKLINDIHGHQAGDYVLKKTASLVMRNLRKEDTLGRYGGEEFAIILPETDLKRSLQIAEKMRSLIENVDYTFNEKKLKVTISIGVSAYSSRKSKTLTYNDLIELADKALYRAKNLGRNKVVGSDEL